MKKKKGLYITGKKKQNGTMPRKLKRLESSLNYDRCRKNNKNSGGNGFVMPMIGKVVS